MAVFLGLVSFFGETRVDGGNAFPVFLNSSCGKGSLFSERFSRRSEYDAG
jgi:hypothetical protein